MMNDQPMTLDQYRADRLAKIHAHHLIWDEQDKATDRARIWGD